jgi:hypothetical protein
MVFIASFERWGFIQLVSPASVCSPLKPFFLYVTPLTMERLLNLLRKGFDARRLQIDHGFARDLLLALRKSLRRNGYSHNGMDKRAKPLARYIFTSRIRIVRQDEAPGFGVNGDLREAREKAISQKSRLARKDGLGVNIGWHILETCLA